MQEFKKQTERLSKNVQQLIDLINKQQTEMQQLKEKYERLKSKNESIITRIIPGQTLLSAMLV